MLLLVQLVSELREVSSPDPALAMVRGGGHAFDMPGKADGMCGGCGCNSGRVSCLDVLGMLPSLFLQYGCLSGRVPTLHFCPRGLIFKRAGFQSSSCQHWCAPFHLLASCQLIDHPGATGHAVGKSSLRLSLPTLDPAQQPHPGEHLRQGTGQGEVVRDIVIAPCPKLKLQPSPLQ